MEVSYRWLADFLDLEFSEEAVNRHADRLTMAGAEVEKIERIGSPSELTAGKVVELTEHPEAENLHLATVQDDNSTVPTITAADNLEVGAIVPMIKAPGKLPDGTKIETRSFRGEESRCMLCSKEELGLEEKSEGIWLLDGFDFSVGDDLTEYLEFDDYVLGFEITSNRPDLLSVLGIARELSVLTETPLKQPDPSFEPDTPSPVKVEIEDPEDTPRYTARSLTGVDVGPSPLKIQHRLAKVGLRPKNNVVDATNYAMMELGHPLHPFDLDRIKGETIKIRRAREEETLKTLDGKERKLDEENLVIADETVPVALAGIMGGESSEVKENSTKVLLEGACFNRARIRKSAQKVGMRTDASNRFEKGADPTATVRAIDRVTELLAEQNAFGKGSALADSYPSPPETREIKLREKRANSIVGVEIGAEEIHRILTGLGCSVVRSEKEDFQVEPPSYRVDLTRETDLIEELARIHGYDRIPETPPSSGTIDLFRTREERATEKAKRILTGLGLNEAISPGFAPETQLDEGLTGVRLKNPMGDKRSELRPDLGSSLIKHAEYNFKEESDSIALFEIGKVFRATGGEPEESGHLGILLAGRRYEGIDGKSHFDFRDLKGVFEDFFETMSVTASFSAGGPDFLHPGRKAVIEVSGESVGYAGELAPDTVGDMELPERTYLADVEFGPIIEETSFEGEYESLPRYPASKRDLSLTVPEDVTEGEIRKIITGKPRVEETYLYDLYQGDQIEAGKRSLTHEITFRDEDKTLSDDEVDEMVSEIREDLESRGITLRE
ncbi:MAG: phenylalanine--tRNA ligase subunit beta [Candidatus Bipolaricaulota bacterium]